MSRVREDEFDEDYGPDDASHDPAAVLVPRPRGCPTRPAGSG